MRISDWSSDVCSSDLGAQLARAVAEYVVEETAAAAPAEARTGDGQRPAALGNQQEAALDHRVALAPDQARVLQVAADALQRCAVGRGLVQLPGHQRRGVVQPQRVAHRLLHVGILVRSEEHTSELQSLMSISFAVVCMKKNTN